MPSEDFVQKIRNVILKRQGLNLKSLPDGCRVSFLDIGAAGELLPRWKQIAERLDYVGLEPHPQSRMKLESSESKFGSSVILEFAADLENGIKKIYLTKDPEKSSFFKPNIELLSRFPDLERFELVEEFPLHTKSLDDLLKDDIDFMKLDVQGCELRVLMGAERALTKCFGVEVEVEFSQLYRGQPLFGDLCEFMEEHNFTFMDFTNLCRWERDKLEGYGQCVFGDALFLKNPEQVDFDSTSDAKLLSYLTILLLYKRIDLIEQIYDSLAFKRQRVLSEFESAYRNRKKKIDRSRKLHGVVNRLWKIFDVTENLHHIY